MTRLTALCAMALGLWMLDGCGGAAKRSDFERELAALDTAIAAASSSLSEAGISAKRAAAVAELVERRASLTGDALDLEHATVALDNALRLAGPVEELLLLDVELKLKTHRVREARRVLDTIPDPSDVPRVMILRADIDVQDGDYANAKRVYESVLESSATWDRMARLAYLESMLGNSDYADTLYASAEEQITAKDMRHFAWLELQRGMLEFRRGRFEPALAHYQRAERAYSGYWMTQDYMAELLAARAGPRSSRAQAGHVQQLTTWALGGEALHGETELRRAAALYEQLLASAAQPPAEQALGDVYTVLGEPGQARAHHERALALYVESVRRGETQYFHHLAGYYADVTMDGAEAVRWARKDLELRSGYASHDALAWALFRSGEFERAKREIDLALAPGIRDAHVLFHAAMIAVAVGHSDEGRRLLREASTVNPQFASFHVHR
jgi:tetratricopeptide (TPR) repeat protein